jgi:uncharacterized protein YggU (UPF0235/DUF167 family)
MTRPVRITVRVSPGSKTTAVVGLYREGWKLRVAASPESGRANDAVVRLLAGVLSLPVQRVAIVAGHASRNKVVEIDGLGLVAIQAALARASGAAAAL